MHLIFSSVAHCVIGMRKLVGGLATLTYKMYGKRKISYLKKVNRFRVAAQTVVVFLSKDREIFQHVIYPNIGISTSIYQKKTGCTADE